MSYLIWIAVAVVLLALVLYVSMTAGRLDRLHQRVDTSLLTLQTHLLRRSATTIEIAASGLVDPATSVVLAERAHAARRASEDGHPQRWQSAESDLSSALVVAFDERLESLTDDEGAELLGDLQQSCRRVELSRRFHNDAVRACRQVRGRTWVRFFRLAGHTPLPQTWEMADDIPVGLQ
jgi:hypothetical protein